MNIFDFNSTFSGDQTALYGKSTEEKPTPETEPGIFAQSNVVVYRELDTGNDYYYDEDEGDWSVMKTSGGGGGSNLPPVTEEDNGDVLSVVDGAWAKSEPKGGDWNASDGEAGYIENRPFYSEDTTGTYMNAKSVVFFNNSWYEDGKYCDSYEFPPIQYSCPVSYAAEYLFNDGQSFTILFDFVGGINSTLTKTDYTPDGNNEVVKFVSDSSDIEAYLFKDSVSGEYSIGLLISENTITQYIPGYEGTPEDPLSFDAQVIEVSIPMTEKVEKIDMKYITEEVYSVYDGLSNDVQQYRLYKDKYGIEGVKKEDFSRLLSVGIVTDPQTSVRYKFLMSGASWLDNAYRDSITIMGYNSNNSQFVPMSFLQGFSSDDDYVIDGYYCGSDGRITLLLSVTDFESDGSNGYNWTGSLLDDDCLKVFNILKINEPSFGLIVKGNNNNNYWLQELDPNTSRRNITRTVSDNTVTVSDKNDSSIVYITSTPTEFQLSHVDSNIYYSAIASSSIYLVLYIDVSYITW